MKEKLFNSETILASLAKVSLFSFFFIFNVQSFARSISAMPVETGETLACDHDSISGISVPAETVKIYVSSGSTIYNAQEFGGQVEIVHEQKPAKKDAGKTIPLKHFGKTAKLNVAKTKKPDVQYTSEIRFRQLPCDTNTMFSTRGSDSVTVPSVNPQFKMMILLDYYQTSFFISLQEKHKSTYILHFIDDIHHRQGNIRPPPSI